MAHRVTLLVIAFWMLQSVKSETKSLCPKSPRAVFHWLPYGDELLTDNNTMRGDLYTFLSSALDVCCSSLKLSYSKMQVNSSKEIELSIREDRSQSLSLYFPVFANKYQKEKFQRPFIGLYDSPGPIVFAVDQPSQKGAVFTALTKSWQIPALCVLLASISGVILWFLDHKHNKRELPQEFHRGSCVGLWWAFVTMTTVGYGDIAPKSFRGRLFAVIWMIIGCIALTLFNAQLTAMITSNEIPTEINLIGRSIIIPRGGKPFLEEELNLGAQFQEEDFDDIVKKIKAKADGLLMMYNYENIKMAQDFSEATSERSTIKILKTIDHRFTIGITASGNISNTEDFLRCIERQVVDSIVITKQNLFKELQSAINMRPVKPTAESEKSNGLPYNLETMATLLALTVLVILVSFGIIMELCGKWRKDNSNNAVPSTTGYSDQLQNQNNHELTAPAQLNPEHGWYRYKDWPSKEV